MKKLLLAISLCSILAACSKTETRLASSTEKKETDKPLTNTPSQKPPGPIGGGGGGVQPTPTYLIPMGGSNYTCNYAGLTINFTSVSWALNGPATGEFNQYGTYYTVDAYANATTSSSNASGGGSGNTFTFNESYCAAINPETGWCLTWANRNISGILVRVLNPPPTAPSFLCLVPPNYFLY